MATSIHQECTNIYHLFTRLRGCIDLHGPQVIISLQVHLQVHKNYDIIFQSCDKLPITLIHYSICILHTILCHLSFYLSAIVYHLNKKSNTCLLNKYDVWYNNPIYFLRQVIFVYIIISYTLYAFPVMMQQQSPSIIDYY